MKFILTCSICLANLNHPVSLHCGHTFCQTCIQTSFLNSDLCLCPLCRSTVYIQPHQTDQILPQVQSIYQTNGTEGLLNEFPSLIICLCCGLTPINPVVLQCQHMFCQQCLSENMEEELICPACQEFSINLEVHVNKKYQDLINWYLQESAIEEEPTQQLTYNLTNFNGLPIFFSDRSVPIFQNVEFHFLELRYQELVKISAQGSGHFIILNSELESQDFGDLVRITKLTKLNKGYLGKVQGICRVNIRNIYTFKRENKLLIQNSNNQELSTNLWLCECSRRNDVDIKLNTISTNWEVIVQTLNLLFKQLPNNLKQHFQRLMEEINKQKQNTKEYQDITLILVAVLNGVGLKQYYTQNIVERLQSIQIYFSQVEQQFHASYLQNNTENKGNKENNSKQINITLYPNLDLQSQYFLNLFDLQKILLL